LKTIIRTVVVAPILAVRTGLRALLSYRGGPEEALLDSLIEVVDEASTLADLDGLPPETDVLVASSDAFSSKELVRLLHDRPGQIGLLLLAPDAAALQSVLGAPLRSWGLLPLEATAEELVATVVAIHEGLVVGTPLLLGAALNRTWDAEGEVSQASFEPLTERETEVLQLLAQGLANKQIAVALGISEHTVKFHVSSLYGKLGATNRTEAVRLGIQSGLILL
jgi:DNA-binding NarL/FixJ family response regulator